MVPNLTSFFRTTGLLVLGKRQETFFNNVVESFENNADKAKYTLHDPKSMSDNYPNLSMGPDIWGCYDPVGGFLMADKALKATWVRPTQVVTRWKNTKYPQKVPIY